MSEIPSGIPSRVGECFQSSFRTVVRVSESCIMMVTDCSVTTGKWALLCGMYYIREKDLFRILTFDS